METYAFFPQNPEWRQLDAGDAIGAAAVIVSLALFAYTRKGQRDPKFVLDLGHAYLVFTAFALSQLFHLGGLTEGGTYLPEISWVGAVVLMFAAIVPSTPKKFLIAGLIAASMNHGSNAL